MLRASARCVVAAALCLFLGALRVSADDFKSQSFPLPIHVDEGKVRSSLFIRLDVKQHGHGLDEFAAKASGGREAAFAKLMGAIRAKNYSEASRAFKPAMRGGAAIDAKTAAIVDTYRTHFDNFERVRVVAQFMVGSKSLFVWEDKRPQGVVRRAFYFDEDAGGNLAGNEVTSLSFPLGTLIVNLMQKQLDDPATFGPAEPPGKRRYSYRLPLGEAGPAAAHPVFLEFDGEPLDLDVFNAGAAAPRHPVVSFYQQAYLDFKKRDLQSFLSKFTPGSRETLQSWFGKLAPATFDQMHKATTKGRRVKFLLDADPIYILFYTDEHVGNVARGQLSYHYVVRESKAGGLKLTNASHESFIDGVLKNPELFDLRKFLEAK